MPGTVSRFPSPHAKRGGEGSGVGGLGRPHPAGRKKTPTRLASLATLPTLASLAGEG